MPPPSLLRFSFFLLTKLQLPRLSRHVGDVHRYVLSRKSRKRNSCLVLMIINVIIPRPPLTYLSTVRLARIIIIHYHPSIRPFTHYQLIFSSPTNQPTNPPTKHEKKNENEKKKKKKEKNTPEPHPPPHPPPTPPCHTPPPRPPRNTPPTAARAPRLPRCFDTRSEPPAPAR